MHYFLFFLVLAEKSISIIVYYHFHYKLDYNYTNPLFSRTHASEHLTLAFKFFRILVVGSIMKSFVVNCVHIN